MTDLATFLGRCTREQLEAMVTILIDTLIDDNTSLQGALTRVTSAGYVRAALKRGAISERVSGGVETILHPATELGKPKE